MLGAFGVNVDVTPSDRTLDSPGASPPPGRAAGHPAGGPVKVSVESDGTPRLTPVELAVPGDFSSAAFWVVAALLIPGSEVRLPRVGLNPTRTGLLRVLERMGAEILLERQAILPGEEPVADIIVRAAAGLRATCVTQPEIPSLIDEIPVLAVAATQAEGETVIEGAGELRHKETDRLEALASELGRMGARVEVEGGRLEVFGPTPLSPARVSAWGDHRMAMALAVAALVASAPPVGAVKMTEIRGFETTAVSYPGFGERLGALLAC
jgi:3-phosphoshikimate 1-carboxyvinyltransferase